MKYYNDNSYIFKYEFKLIISHSLIHWDILLSAVNCSKEKTLFYMVINRFGIVDRIQVDCITFVIQLTIMIQDIMFLRYY